MGEAEATTEKIRLWGCTQKEKLLNSYKLISKNAQSQETTSQLTDADIEQNSGVEFPGQSLEPIVGTTFTIDEKDF